MDDDERVHADVQLSGHVTVSEGCFGSITWSVCDDLYAVLPRNKRDALLTMTANRVIEPFFNGLAARLLAQAGCEGNVRLQDLETTWSFETRTVTCSFGKVDWLIGQGLWDSLPEDQRDKLCELTDVLVHNFFTGEVLQPLYTYAYRQLHG